MSYLVYGNQDAHPTIRQALATIVEKNRNRFEQYIMEGTFDDHIIAMKREGAWGSQVELFAAATYFRMPLYVCSPHPATKEYRWLYFPPVNHCELVEHKSIPRMPINIQHIELCHSAGCHYDCVVDKQNTFPTTPPHLQCDSTIINIH